MYNKEESLDGACIPESADRLATALCADYFRRESAIKEGDAPLRVRMEYEYLNRRIFTAARELCDGEEDALGYIEEIGAKRGYAKSRFTVSEKTYKVKKREVMLNILRRLYLLEAQRGASIKKNKEDVEK
ncbi:MAG: hypothetical protein IKA53_01070 [Clostridia bacterium]|nr:hypothetical protein [Clostridia bacterium]